MLGHVFKHRGISIAIKTTQAHVRLNRLPLLSLLLLLLQALARLLCPLMPSGPSLVMTSTAGDPTVRGCWQKQL